jgi:hypothetical protein
MDEKPGQRHAMSDSINPRSAWTFDSAWCEEPVFIDIGFLLEPAFYFGPENNFTAQQWEELRDPLEQPRIRKRKHGAHHAWNCVLSADVVGHEEELRRHFQDVVAKAKHHGKSLKNSTCFWNDLFIYAPERFTIDFPWHDQLRDIKPLVQTLAQATEGLVLSDRDQGWEVDIELHEGVLYVQQQDPDSEIIHHNVKFEYQPFRNQAVELLPRVERIVAFVADRLGENHWT